MTDPTSTLITAAEVLASTPKGQGSDAQAIEPFIALKEEGLFRVWLGLDFYEALIDNKTDNSAAVNFVEGSSYILGDKVKWRDEIFEATAATAGALPRDASKWQVATKFDDVNFEFLWRRYLRTVLAWHIMTTSLVYNAIKQTNLAVVKVSNEGKERPVSGSELAAFKGELGFDFNDFLLTMDSYLRRNSGVFALYLPNQEGNPGKTVVGQPVQNFGFTCFDE